MKLEPLTLSCIVSCLSFILFYFIIETDFINPNWMVVIMILIFALCAYVTVITDEYRNNETGGEE